MNSDARRFAIAAAVCWCLAGWAFNACESRLAAREVEWGASSPAERLLAQAGTLQPLLSDWFWLRANLSWEMRDEAATRLWLRLASASEPRRTYFRVNAARMIAFDFPAWAEARDPRAPLAVHRARQERNAKEAMQLLFRAPPDALGPADWIEAGNIALYGQGDLLQAAQHYRRAAEMPEAPWHAGRICAQLLIAAGRPAEALAWLRTWLPRLPQDDATARRELVEAQIADLERAFGQTEAF